MNTSRYLALALASGLAIGCASATAQDGPGNPPPVPPAPPEPPRPPRPPHDPEARRAVEERIRDAEARLAQLERDGFGPNHPEVQTTRADLERLRAHLAEVKAHLAEIDAHRDQAEAERRRGEAERRGPDGDPVRRGPGDERRVEEERPNAGESGRPRPEGGDRRYARFDFRPGGLDHRGPSVEQRLEQLERAVREMHELFQRHDVGPEARERAERAMRERREGAPPPEGGGPERPGEGQPGGGPSAGGGDPRGPTMGGGPRMPPPRAQPGMPDMQEIQRHMEAARDQIAALTKQLAETQAALKKTQEELDALRAKK